MAKFLIKNYENEECFGFEVADKDLGKAIELSKKGLGYWHMASNEDIDDSEDFTKDEIESFYNLGYAEPSIILLEKYGIEYKELEYDFYDNIIPDDVMIIEY